MPHFPAAYDEMARLAALKALEIVDTAPSAGFNTVVALAAESLSCPIACVAMLEKDRQWFKAQIGVALASTPRDIAFCNYTVLGEGVFTVADMRIDPRFASNPLVTGELGIRAYAGVPLKCSSGHPVGALCVADTSPRHFTVGDKARLRQLGELTEALLLAHGEQVTAARVARDVSEKARELWQKNRLLQQVERIGKIGGWELDVATNIVTWSDEVARIHELPAGKTCTLDEALAFYPDSAQVARSVARAIELGEPYQFEAAFVSASGARKWVRAAGECERRHGETVRLFGMFEDVTQEKQAEELLWQAANVDELTGLANRHRFNAVLNDRMRACRAETTGLTLMIFDLDNFKEINDTHGHAVGDHVLAEVGRRFQKLSPEGALIARLGGDEFAVIVPGTTLHTQIEGIGRRLLRGMRQPIQIGAEHIYVNSTVGAARFPQDASSAAGLLKMADLSLYSAKQTDRGAVRLYSNDIASLFERRSSAIELVRNALDQRTLIPFYQPKICLKTSACFGFEALARIRSPDGAVIGPPAFAAAFQDRAMARRVGKRMLTEVVEDIAAWKGQRLGPISVSLNASEYDFADGSFAMRVLRALEEHDVPTTWLTIEVTESVFLGAKASLARQALVALDAAGVQIELDDFGTGYASLTHLRSIPVSRLKIDRSFIENICEDGSSSAIVQAVIDMGHRLGCEIIAEGVEREDQAELLRTMGCDAGQGFLFSRPMEKTQASQYLSIPPPDQSALLRDFAAQMRREAVTAPESDRSQRLALG